MKHYVYLHRKATDGAIFYVGKGKDRRAWASSGRNKWWKHISQKHGFTVEILKSGLGEYCALALERITISRIGISNLANLVEGGGGTQGWRHSKDTRLRISEAGKGRKHTVRQRAVLESIKYMERTPEHRRRMSEAAKNRVRAPHSQETRAKISASHIGIRPNIEALAKMRAAKLGKSSGKNSPSYDHQVRTFAHDNIGTFVGTRAEFIAEFNLANGCVSSLISGKRKSVKGWRKV